MRDKLQNILVSAFILLLLGFDECAAEFFTTLNLPRVRDGQKVCLIDSDTGEVFDSIPVMDESVVFLSDRYRPCVVTVSVDDQDYGNCTLRNAFILSNAQITLDVKVEEIEGGVRRTWKASGAYNDSIDVFMQQYAEVLDNLKQAETKQAQDSIKDAFRSFLLGKIASNADNILGYKFFAMSENVLTLENLENLLV